MEQHPHADGWMHLWLKVVEMMERTEITKRNDNADLPQLCRAHHSRVSTRPAECEKLLSFDKLCPSVIIPKDKTGDGACKFVERQKERALEAIATMSRNHRSCCQCHVALLHQRGTRKTTMLSARQPAALAASRENMSFYKNSRSAKGPNATGK